jgi:hypothetical protein
MANGNAPKPAIGRRQAGAPDVPGTHNNLGHVLQQRDDLAGAAAEYARALALDPRHADAIANTGLLLEEQGRRDEAMDHYRRALAVDARHPRAAYNLGLAYLHRGDFPSGWGLTESRFDTFPPVAARPNLSLPAFMRDWGGGHAWRSGRSRAWATSSCTRPVAGPRARGEELSSKPTWRPVPAFARASALERGAGTERVRHLRAWGDRDRPVCGPLRRDAPSSGPAAALLPPIAPRLIPRAWARPRDRDLWRSSSRRANRGGEKSAPLAAFGALAARGAPSSTCSTMAPGARSVGGPRRRAEQWPDSTSRGHRRRAAAIAACDAVVTTSNVTSTPPARSAATAPYRAGCSSTMGSGADGRSRWYPSVEIVSDPGIDTWEAALARAHELLG